MLTSLEIQGFKSFPDYTKLDFHKGITAIVGPNGAGKSNITDAIRWVLGEQSAKTLRGQRMEDVIFNGTAQRRPVSFCEVTLTFDNSKGILPIDYETVTISRRYYRSGDSEYLINKTPCRLKDINLLLMDTGIGLDGYSIIGQGRIDEILSNKSEDRRAIFEEASGIVQYRTRKEEALRKLDRSEQNLVRVDDLLAELEDQAGVLEKQAEDARSHLDLARRYKELDIALTLRQIRNLEDQMAKGEEDILLIKSDLDRILLDQAGSRTAYEASLDRIRDLDRDLEEEQVRFNSYSVQETEYRGLDALYKEKYASSKEGAESLLEEKNRLVFQVMAAEEDLAARKSRRLELEEQLKSQGDRARDAREQVEVEEERVRRSGRELRDLMARRSDLAERLASRRASLEGKAGEILVLEEALAEGRDRGDRLIRELEAEEKSLAHKRGEIRDLVEAIRTCEEEALLARKRTGEGHLAADRLEGALEESIRSVRELLYEADTLERLESDFEGYSRPVQALMKNKAQGGRGEGLYGPLGSLLTVEKGMEEALATALGASAHHLVCDRPDQAQGWIDWLRQQRAGRATFLPLEALSVRPVDQASLQKARNSRGFLGLASDLVAYEPAVRQAVLYSLSRTFVVEKLEDAVDLSQKTNRAYTVVTLAGDQVSRGGAMTGGYRSSGSSGVLGRPGRIKAAREEAKAKQKAIEVLKADLEEAKDKLRLAASKEEALLEDLARDKRTLARLHAEEKAGLMARDRLAGLLEDHEKDKDRTGERIRVLALEITELKNQVLDLDRQREEAQGRLEGLEEDRIREEEDFNQARDQLTRLEVSLAGLEEALASFDQMTRATGRDMEEAKARLASVDREWKDQTSRMEEARQAIEKNQGDLEEAMKCRQACQDLVAALMDAREEEAQKQRTLLAGMNQVNDQAASIQGVYERQRAEIQRLDLQVRDQVNRLWEGHGLTRFEAENEEVDPGPISRATAERAGLKRQIEDLGPINHKAIRDFEILSERIDYTLTQRQDIERAQEDLEGIIRDLDQSMREQFNRTLHEINQNFNQVFTELFSGGQAEIVLEGEEDVLRADIGIQAQPPGKKLQKLSLLSGGERSLTAIALLFAILKLKPAPFCVFDEVESALDDANVKRFTDYVRRYAWSMQFILVTHRKGTMEASDRLYGVTMQERGISRVLSMVLSSALPYGD